MTDRNELHTLRTSAKHIARATRIPHYEALDIVASKCGHPHWNALTAEWAKGWRPTAEQLGLLLKPHAADANPRGVDSVSVSEGVIEDEPYVLEVGFDYAVIGGRGWAIYLGHAPSEGAKIEKYCTPNPLDDEDFFLEVIHIVSEAADGVREAIAKDWPRRSTKPDKEGRVAHPLFGDVSAEWYCLHCDARSTGAEMAANMWHCPKCSATPLDMHASAWWKEPAPSEQVASERNTSRRRVMRRKLREGSSPEGPRRKAARGKA